MAKVSGVAHADLRNLASGAGGTPPVTAVDENENRSDAGASQDGHAPRTITVRFTTAVNQYHVGDVVELSLDHPITMQYVNRGWAQLEFVGGQAV